MPNATSRAQYHERFSKMLMETTRLIEPRIDLESGMGPHGVGRAQSMNGRPLEGSDSSPVPYAVLVKLLHSAQQALEGDDDEAKKFIINAADLLDAEVHRREASEFPEQVRTGDRHLAPWQT